MTMDELQQAAKVAFATEYSFYLKAHNFHWNVEGSDFKQYHDLFGGIYEEVYGSIDAFAEQIRALGTYVPASYTRFSMLTQIEDETQILPRQAMVEALLVDNEKTVKLLKLVFQQSEANQEFGFSDFIASRIDAHRKHGWMLRASAKV
jgi:starvation-inducible DNA-binding protein